MRVRLPHSGSIQCYPPPVVVLDMLAAAVFGAKPRIERACPGFFHIRDWLRPVCWPRFRRFGQSVEHLAPLHGAAADLACRAAPALPALCRLLLHGGGAVWRNRLARSHAAVDRPDAGRATGVR